MKSGDRITNQDVNNMSMGVSTKTLTDETLLVEGLVVGFYPSDGSTVTIDSATKYSEDSRADVPAGTYSYPVGVFMVDPTFIVVGTALIVLG